MSGRRFGALRAIGRLIGQAWLILGITLLLLLGVDQLLRALLPAGERVAALEPGVIAPGRSRAAAVADDDWIDDYWNEHEASRYTQWVSYVYWRRKPFDGALIDVDAHGFRSTPPAPYPPQRTIWLFGGSVVWGTGNRNQGTLAAQLQRIYAERAPDLRVRVLNFGESGYVSRQSLLALQSALACPAAAADLAISLDGANDVFAALQQGEAGLPQNEDNRRREFNSSRQLGQQLRAWSLRLEGIMRLVAAPADAETTTSETLAKAVAQNYLSQARQAMALAQAYDLPLLLAWQPTVFDRAKPVGDERAIVAASMARHVQLQRQTRAQLQAELSTLSLPFAVDLGASFDASEEPVFFDFVHLSEHGQDLLAQRLYALSEPSLRARPARVAGVESCRDRPLM